MRIKQTFALAYLIAASNPRLADPPPPPTVLAPRNSPESLYTEEDRPKRQVMAVQINRPTTLYSWPSTQVGTETLRVPRFGDLLDSGKAGERLSCREVQLPQPMNHVEFADRMSLAPVLSTLPLLVSLSLSLALPHDPCELDS